MSKKFVKYCLLLNLIFISPINDLKAMNQEDTRCKNPRVVVYNRNQILTERQAKEEALKAEQEKQALAREKERREVVQKIHENRKKVRDSIKTAEQKLADGEDKVLEDHIGKLEDAIRGQSVAKGEINTIWTDASYLLAEENNPDNNARGVILSLAVARYYGAIGDISSTMKYLKSAATYDPDIEKFREILMGVKQKIDEDVKKATQQKTLEIATKTESAREEGMKRGLLIGAGSMAALAVTWWGYSYIFGK